MPGGHELREEEPADDLDQAQDDAQDDQRARSREAHDVQRRVAEAEDPLLGPADVLEQVVGASRRTSARAGRSRRRSAGSRRRPARRGGTGRARGTARIAWTTRRSISEKSPASCGIADVGEVVEDPVERLVGELHEQGGLALDPPAVDDVVALAPERDELLDQLGRVLEVAVEQDAGVLRGDLHAAAEGRLRAEVPRVGDADAPAGRFARWRGSPPRSRRGCSR